MPEKKVGVKKTNVKTLLLLTGLTASFGVASQAVKAQEYDVVILNGRVMDPETGFDGVANVGISNGWIVRITTEAP